MKTIRITDPTKCPITVEHVGLKNICDTCWQHSETEASAYWLVRLAKTNGSWRPFTMEELNKLYHAKFPDHDFRFNRLVNYHDGSYSYIQTDQGGKMYFTFQFVAEIYRVSPVVEVAND